MLARLLALGALAAASTHRAHGDHPAVKILALLEKLQAQVKEEAAEETATFAKFQYWCVDLIGAKKKSISEEEDNIEVADTTIGALTADMTELDASILAITADIAAGQAARRSARNDRNDENAIFLQSKKDLDGTISAISSAITSLEGTEPALLQADVLKSAVALVDMFAKPKQAQKVHAFLGHREDPGTATTSRNATTVNYDFKSGGVIEVLKQLQMRFEDELTDASQAETANLNAWKLADAAAEDELDAMRVAKTTKESINSRKGVELATATGEFNDATSTKTTADTVLSQTENTCRSREDEFNERSSRRAGELKAMAKACEIMEKTTGLRAPADKLEADDMNYAALVQTSFVQLSTQWDEPFAKAVALLRKASVGSDDKKALIKLADHISAAKAGAFATAKTGGVFDEISNMIQKMMFTLMAEQAKEDEHKNWCDKENKTSVELKDAKETKIDSLDADITAIKAELKTLKNSIAANMKSMATLEEDIEEQTTQRQESHHENSETVKDAQKAQTAVASAVAVLSDFYKSTGELELDTWDAGYEAPADFLQLQVGRRSGEDPAMPSASAGTYTGTGGGSAVVGMLQNIGSDFASMEAKAKSDEMTQQDEFDTWLTAAKNNNAALEKDTAMKKAKSETETTKLKDKTADHGHNTEELEKVDQYLTALEPACINGDSSYTDRKAARTAETEALQEAEKILREAFEESD